MRQIIRKAGLVPWPKLFQNLRASRATELAAAHPGHVAANWIGHSTTIAAKHYWQTTEDDFARALQNPVQQASASGRSESHAENDDAANTEETDTPSTIVIGEVGVTELETRIYCLKI